MPKEISQVCWKITNIKIQVSEYKKNTNKSTLTVKVQILNNKY